MGYRMGSQHFADYVGCVLGHVRTLLAGKILAVGTRVNNTIGQGTEDDLAAKEDWRRVGRNLKIAIALAALSQVAVILGLAWLFSSVL